MSFYRIFQGVKKVSLFIVGSSSSWSSKFFLHFCQPNSRAKKKRARPQGERSSAFGLASLGIRACFEKDVFYNGQFTAIVEQLISGEKQKMSKKTVFMRLLWESIKCYTDDFKNKKMFFLTLLDSINFLQKYFENFGQKFQIFFSNFIHWAVYHFGV